VNKFNIADVLNIISSDNDKYLCILAAQASKGYKFAFLFFEATISDQKEKLKTKQTLKEYGFTVSEKPMTTQDTNEPYSRVKVSW